MDKKPSNLHSGLLSDDELYNVLKRTWECVEDYGSHDPIDIIGYLSYASLYPLQCIGLSSLIDNITKIENIEDLVEAYSEYPDRPQVEANEIDRMLKELYFYHFTIIYLHSLITGRHDPTGARERYDTPYGNQMDMFIAACKGHFVPIKVEGQN